jgi:hypothetical protein
MSYGSPTRYGTPRGQPNITGMTWENLAKTVLAALPPTNVYITFILSVLASRIAGLAVYALLATRALARTHRRDVAEVVASLHPGHRDSHVDVRPRRSIGRRQPRRGR